MAAHVKPGEWSKVFEHMMKYYHNPNIRIVNKDGLSIGIFNQSTIVGLSISHDFHTEYDYGDISEDFQGTNDFLEFLSDQYHEDNNFK